jgi:hypothetical protein
MPPPEAVEATVGCSGEALRAAEAAVCSALGDSAGAISAMRVLHLYLDRLGCDFQVRAAQRGAVR